MGGGLTFNLQKKEEYEFSLLPGGGLVKVMDKTLDMINQSLRHHRILSAEEERELALAATAGDSTARQALAESQYKLVYSIAKKIAYKRRRTDLLKDCFQAGLRALLECIPEYDPTRGARLITFVYWPTTKAILTEVKNSINKMPSDELPEAVQDVDRRKALFLVLNRILPPEQSEVIRYHVSQDMSFKEIARRNGKSESTWRRRYDAAIERLGQYRAYLEQNGLC
jgi:RNA polymerase sigma factor (sigma-70 family)